MKTSSGKKIVRVPYTVALEILAPLQLGPPRLDPPLPGGTAVLSVHDNHQCRALDFTVQSEDFQSVELGAMLPIHEGNFVRQGALLLLRREEGEFTKPGRVAVITRLALYELGTIHTPGLSGVCIFQPKDGAPPMSAAELAELARHVEQFDRGVVELAEAKARHDAAEKEGAK